MSNYVTAIDLGTTKVVTIVGEETSSGVKIVAYSEAPSNGVVRGEVLNISHVLESLQPTIDSVLEQMKDVINDFTIKDIYLGIAGQNIRCDSCSIKKHRDGDALIREEEIESMLEEVYNSRTAPGEVILHVIPQLYNVDDHIGLTEPVGMLGKEIDGTYRIFIGKANSASSSKHVIKRTGLNTKKLILEPIASARAVLTSDDMELGVAMVDIGGGTTDLLIYHENTIRHTAVIPFGGNSITEDIRLTCGVSLKHAEAMKKQHGSCLSEYAPDNKSIVIPGLGGAGDKEITFKLLSSAIEARVEEIFKSVKEEIEKSGYQDKLRNGLVLTGGTSLLNHIQITAKKITKMNVRIALPNDPIVLSNSCEDIYKPSASTAVGLVLKGFDYISEHSKSVEEDKATTTSTLFPDEEKPSVTKPDKEVRKKEKRETPKKSFSDRIGGLFNGMFDSETDNNA